MNLLITGGSGFLGSHLVERYVSADHRARVLVRNTSTLDILKCLGAEIVRGDLKSAESLHRAVAGMDAVINAAASMDGVPSRDRGRYHQRDA